MDESVNGTDHKHAKDKGAKLSSRSSSEDAKRDGEDRADLVSGLAVRGHDLTSEVARSAQGLIKAELGKRTNKGASDLGDVANALRESSKTLEDNMVAPYMEKAADQIERASEFIRSGDLHEMKRSVESFAKREPLLFLGGAFALGLLGARFIKSSAHADASAKEEESTRRASPKRKRARAESSRS